MTTTFSAFESALRTYIDDNFSLAPQVLHDNDFPLGTKSGTVAPSTVPGDANAAWARFSIALGDATLDEIGGPGTPSNQTGRLTVQLFAPLGSGLAALQTLADEIASLFQRQRIADATFREVEVMGRGADPSNVWYSVTLSIPFHFDHLPA